MPKPRLVVGCMTGTSCDGLDCALVQIEGQGLDIQAQVLRCLSTPLGKLGVRLKDACDQKPLTALAWAQLSTELAEAHATAINRLLDGKQADLICVHGQTVCHQPPISAQIINAPLISKRTHTTVISDLRAADITLGGQGAPMTPLADYILFRDTIERRTIVNLGGFCNITFLPNDSCIEKIQGRDISACNHILNDLARKFYNSDFDPDGQYAESGTVDTHCEERWLKALQQQQRGRSLGTGDEQPAQARCEHDADTLASVCSALARHIVNNCEQASDRMLIAGGGAYNKGLMKYLHLHSSIPVEQTDAYGIDIQEREAVCMAILGALCADKQAITLPHITGASCSTVAGSWSYP